MESVGLLTDKAVSAVIAHPVRVQILIVVNDRPISPSRYVMEVMGFDPETQPADHKRGLSHISYHFKVLAKHGCIEAVDLVQKRGAVEHVYGPVVRANLDTEEWADVPMERRPGIVTVLLRELMVRMEAARLSGTYCNRDDNWLAWTDALLDERGWSEISETLAFNFAECERIRESAEARLEETEEKGIKATFAVAGFERPGEIFYSGHPTAKPKAV
jgi:hypothetical protein